MSDSSTLVNEKSFSDVVYGNGMLYLVSGSMIYKYDIKNNGMRILYRSLNNPQYIAFDETTGYAEFFCNNQSLSLISSYSTVCLLISPS